MNLHRNRRRFRTFCLFLAYACEATYLCPAQSPAALGSFPPSLSFLAEQQAAPASAQQSNSNPSSANTSQQTPEKKEKKKKKKKKESNGSFVIAPLPIVSPAIGSGLIPIIGYITPVPQKEREETPSVVGAGGLITNNGSRAFFLGTDLYFNQERYEVEAVYAHGSLDYSLYGPGFVNGGADFKLPLEQSGQAFFIKGLRLIRWKTYVGGRFSTGTSFITVKPAPESYPRSPLRSGCIHNFARLA